MLSDRFRAAVEQGNIDAAADLFSEDATFRSPVLFKPYEGRDQVVRALRAALWVLGRGGGFRYMHQLEDPGPRRDPRIRNGGGGKQVEGIDKLTFRRRRQDHRA